MEGYTKTVGFHFYSFVRISVGTLKEKLEHKIMYTTVHPIKIYSFIVDIFQYTKYLKKHIGICPRDPNGVSLFIPRLIHIPNIVLLKMHGVNLNFVRKCVDEISTSH